MPNRQPNKPTVTLAVMAFKRPDMIEDIIKCYDLQSVDNKQLLIIDDCVEDESVKDTVKSFQGKVDGIKYIKNKENLGYCKNYLKLLNECDGEYIVILGDDDLLITPDALQKYIDVFESNPSVGYAYSNIIQFNQNYEMDLAFNDYKDDTLFNDLDDALKGIWLESCYIPGMAFRNNINFNAIYPKDYLLFPQVELVGKILGSYKSYGISDFLIGGRAHSGQLGFAALKGKNIKKTEKPSVVELQYITERVNAYYSDVLGLDYKISKSIANNFFKRAHATILPNEKINIGNKQVAVTFWLGFRNNRLLVFDPRFMFYVAISLLLPKMVLYKLKETRKKQLISNNNKDDIRQFKTFMTMIGR